VADIRVDVWQVVRDEEGNDVILLRDEQGRVLPIQIGPCEAAAIWVALSPELAASYVRRPWSHDLIHAMLERMGASLERVVIDNFDRGIFFATLHIMYQGQEVIVDARPSDSIALVLRMPAPVFVNDEVMEMAAMHPEDQDSDDGELWEDMP
jgi:bifunctional DNase/RNase